jgi:hypothetical protein
MLRRPAPGAKRNDARLLQYLSDKHGGTASERAAKMPRLTNNDPPRFGGSDQ